jgi:hypothetical protein
VLIDNIATATNRFNQRKFSYPQRRCRGSREHFDSMVMMVLLCGGVEGSAKIAMTPLHSGCVAMGLLPNDRAAEAHFSQPRHRTNLLI